MVALYGAPEAVGAATIARTSWEKALVVSFGLKDFSAVTAGIEAITGIWFAKTVKESFSNKKAVAEALNECRKLL